MHIKQSMPIVIFVIAFKAGAIYYGKPLFVNVTLIKVALVKFHIVIRSHVI